MIEYEGDQENEGQMVPLAAPAVTQGGEIRKAQKTNKTRPRIDRERLKALLENETDNPGGLMDTIEEMFLPDQQPPPAQQNQQAYRGCNPNNDRCYVCNEPGHYANQCWQVPNPLPLQVRPMEEVRAIMAPARVAKSEESNEKSQSRLLFVHKNNSEHEQMAKPLPVITQAYPTCLPRLLQQKPRVHFAKKSDTISMKVTACPTEKVFEDPFPQDLESLFLKEDVVSAKSSSEDTTIAEAINAFVESIKLVEDTGALLADVSG